MYTNHNQVCLYTKRSPSLRNTMVTRANNCVHSPQRTTTTVCIQKTIFFRTTHMRRRVLVHSISLYKNKFMYARSILRNLQLTNHDWIFEQICIIQWFAAIRSDSGHLGRRGFGKCQCEFRATNGAWHAGWLELRRRPHQCLGRHNRMTMFTWARDRTHRCSRRLIGLKLDKYCNFLQNWWAAVWARVMEWATSLNEPT